MKAQPDSPAHPVGGACQPPSKFGGYPQGTVWCCATCKAFWYVNGHEWEFLSRPDQIPEPPLVLPTEPTWGIAVCPKPKGMDTGAHDESFAMVGRWARYDSDPDILTRTHRDFQTGFDTLDVSFLLDFIEFTPEQIARLEQNL